MLTAQFSSHTPIQDSAHEMSAVLLCISVAVNTLTTCSMGRGGLTLAYRVQPITEVCQSRYSRQQLKAEFTQGHCYWLAQLRFLYTQTH